MRTGPPGPRSAPARLPVRREPAVTTLVDRLQRDLFWKVRADAASRRRRARVARARVPVLRPGRLAARPRGRGRGRAEAHVRLEQLPRAGRRSPGGGRGRDAVERFGTGCTGSRLMNGTLDLHLELEHELADWMQRDAALVFTAGYLANLATIATLCGPDDVIVTDAKNHASIEDGAQLSGRAGRARPPQRPRPARDASSPGSRRTGGRCSSSGTPCSRWRATSSISRGCSRWQRAGARTLIDEAHSLGLFGPDGGGIVDRARPRRRPRHGHVQQVARLVRRRDRGRHRRHRAPPHPRPPVRLHRLRGAGRGRRGAGGRCGSAARSRGGGPPRSRWPTRLADGLRALGHDVSFGGSARSSACACATSGTRRSRGARCSKPAST